MKLFHKHKSNYDFVRKSYITGKALKTYLSVSLFNMLILQINNLIDSILLGNFTGPFAVSTLGLCNPLLEFCTSIPFILVVGGSLIASRALGAGNKDEVNNQFSVSLFSSILIGLLLTISIILLRDPLTAAISNDETLRNYIRSYNPMVGLIALTYSIQNVYTVYMTVAGKTEAVIRISVTQVVMNIILDDVFICAMGWGLIGSAVATCISYVFPLFWEVGRVSKDAPWISKPRNILKKAIFLPTIRKALRHGIPNGISLFTASVVYYVMNTIVGNVYGVDGIFALSVAAQVMTIPTLIMKSSCSAVETLGSIMIGEGDLQGVRQILHKVLKYMSASLALLSVLILLAPETLAVLFGADVRLADYSAMPIRILVLKYLPDGIIYLLFTVLIIWDRLKERVLLDAGFDLVIIATALLLWKFLPSTIWWVLPLSSFLWLVVTLSYMSFTGRKSRIGNWFSLVPKAGDYVCADISVPYENSKINNAKAELKHFLEICELPEEDTSRIEHSLDCLLLNLAERHPEAHKEEKFDIKIVDKNDFPSGGRFIKVVLKDYGSPYDPSRIPTIINPHYFYSNRINCTVLNFEIKS